MGIVRKGNGVKVMKQSFWLYLLVWSTHDTGLLCVSVDLCVPTKPDDIAVDPCPVCCSCAHEWF